MAGPRRWRILAAVLGRVHACARQVWHGASISVSCRVAATPITYRYAWSGFSSRETQLRAPTSSRNPRNSQLFFPWIRAIRVIRVRSFFNPRHPRDPRPLFPSIRAIRVIRVCSFLQSASSAQSASALLDPRHPRNPRPPVCRRSVHCA